MVVKKKPADELVLFPEVKIDGTDIVLKPWSFGILLDVNPYLEAAFSRLEEKKVHFTLPDLDLLQLKEIYFAATPQLLKIICLSTGKSEEDIRDLSLEQVIKIVYIMWNQNSDSLKNGFALFTTDLKESQEESVSSENEK